MKLSSTTSLSKIRYDQDTSVKLLLKTIAPKLRITDRKPLNLIVALDVSSSMSSESKIDYVRQSALKLLDQLNSEDRLGVVLFNHYVSPLFELTHMDPASKDKYRQHLQGINASGSTNFSGAMLEAVNQAKKCGESVRVVILTDGQPTVGETNNSRIVGLLKENLGENVTVTAFGYGADHDENFLAELAQVGKGNFAYIKNPDDALTAFAKELGGLLSCCGQNLKYRLTVKDGHKIAKVVSDVDVQEIGTGILIEVPDLYSEEVRNIVCDVTLTKQVKVYPRAMTVIDVALEYLDAQTGETKTVTDKVKVKWVKVGDEDKTPNKEVMEQAALADLMNAQKEAVKFATQGNYGAASATMSSVDATYLSAPAAAYRISTISEVSGRGNFESARKGLRAATAAYRTGRTGGSTVMGSSLFNSTNSVQDQMIGTFTGDPPDLTLGGTFTGDQNVSLDPAQIKSSQEGEEKKTVAKKRSGW